MKYTDPNHAFKFDSPLVSACRTTSGSIKVAGFTNFLHLNNPQYSVFSFTTKKKSNMQFKVSALIFATLAAAGALPRADANIAPPFPGNPPPTIDASKCSSGHLRCCKFHFPKSVVVLR